MPVSPAMTLTSLTKLSSQFRHILSESRLSVSARSIAELSDAQEAIKKAGMQDVRFTFAGNNLHYFTNVIGMSPEVGTTDSYSGTNNYPRSESSPSV